CRHDSREGISLLHMGTSAPRTDRARRRPADTRSPQLHQLPPRGSGQLAGWTKIFGSVGLRSCLVPIVPAPRAPIPPAPPTDGPPLAAPQTTVVCIAVAKSLEDSFVPDLANDDVLGKQEQLIAKVKEKGGHAGNVTLQRELGWEEET